MLARIGRYAGLTALLTLVAFGVAPGVTGATTPADWPAYIYGAGHSSYNAAATTITPANVGSLTKYWQWSPEPNTIPGQPAAKALYSSPVVVGGRVYIGGHNGNFYALDLATKTKVWERFFGFVGQHTCAARGFASTATVVPDPSRGGQLTVYVAAADGYVYALNAATGATVWQGLVHVPSTTQNDYYNWASPTVANGKVYMGITSQCDKPLIRGGVIGFDQATGATIGTYFSMAAGHVGGGVWSSVAVGPNGDVYAATGTGRIDDAEAIVRLDGNTLARIEAWQIPSNEAINDSDFGASPTIFTATLGGVPTTMVGACNKNGIFYAMRATDLSSGPVWKFNTAKGSAAGQSACITAAIWDGARLFVAAAPTTINGTLFQGSVRQLNPDTGAPIWQTGLSEIVLGSPTLDGGGVIAIGTYVNPSTANGLYLVQASNGHVLRKIITNKSTVFAQAVFADNYLVIATAGGAGLMVYRI
jgi:outer membrane protein assembly factor BamB